MADNTSIEWTEATWNPVTGCTKVSAGCDHCYAERIVERFHGKGSFAIVQRSEDKVYLPMKWKRPRRVFVNSMSDLFHDDVPDSFIANVFSVMARTPRHTYQVLTKRHGRMRSLLNRPSFRDNLAMWGPWPLPNVWLGVSVEDQKWADIRIPALLDTPSAVRWLSLEPLLGPVDLRVVPGLEGQYGHAGQHHGTGAADCPMVLHHHHDERCQFPIDWVVVGGESGPGARPMHPDWARALRDQCRAVGAPFFFKQWGQWVPEAMWLHRGTAPAAFLSADGTVRPLVKGKPLAPPMSRGDDITIRRVGKKAGGRHLDRVLHDAYPAVAS